jgi:hypothetical protein
MEGCVVIMGKVKNANKNLVERLKGKCLSEKLSAGTRIILK